MAFTNAITILRFKNDFGIIEMLQLSDFFEDATPDLENLISVQFLKSTIETFSTIFKLCKFSFQNVLASYLTAQ